MSSCRYLKLKYQQYKAATNEFKIIRTSYGLVKGRKCLNLYKEHGHFYAFEGIPYGKPPLGELRFRAPQPPDTWQYVLDCTKSSTKPVQFNFALRMVEGSEDCLNLNVYAKNVRHLYFYFYKYERNLMDFL